MNKVISVSLFGTDAGKFSPYIKAFVRGHHNLFSLDEGWRLRVHVDSAAAKSPTGRLLLHYKDAGLVDLQLMYRDCGPQNDRSPPKCKGMIWRMDPVFDFAVDYVFCRDLDSPPMPRDRACCDAFIASKATVHTIHDSDQHVGVMGGLCGFFAPQFRRQTGLHALDDLIAASGLSESEWGTHGADQIALNRICLRSGGPTLLEHRYNGWWNGPGARPAKSNGEYPCASWSARVPDEGVFLSNQINGRLYGYHSYSADLLGAHLGCAGYNYSNVVDFWNKYGDPDITDKIAECER